MSNSIHYKAATLEGLSAQLSENIAQEKCVFRSIYVVNAPPSSNEWWLQQLLEKNGIVADVHFKQPKSVIEQLSYQILGPQAVAQIAPPHLLCWQIYALLETTIFQQKFPETAAYYSNNNVQQWVLASKIADLFHQYEQQLIDPIEAGDDFQKYIWQNIPKTGGLPPITSESFLEEIQQQLLQKNTKKKLQSQFAILHLLHPEQLQPLALKFFQLLSQHLKIFIYSHQFSASDTAAFLAQKWLLKPTLPINFEASQALYIPRSTQPPKHLLAKVQTNLSLGTDQNTILSDRDDSIQIDCCHNIARCVEVLYDYLVDKVLHASSPYAAKDILVQVVNIEQYYAAIQRVFGAANYPLPFHINYAPPSTTDSSWHVLGLLLEMNKQLKARSVIELINCAALQRSYEFDDIVAVKSMIEAANIRCGIRGDTDLETNSVSWTKGLQRLIYGYCMANQQFYSFQNGTVLQEAWAVDKVEGPSFNDLMRLKALITSLNDWLKIQQTPRKLHDWNEILLHSISQFMDTEAQLELTSLIHKIRSCQSINSPQKPISYTVYQSYIQQLIQSEQRVLKRSNKGICFSPIEHHLAVPKKIICFLGIDLHRYPREEQIYQFDLSRKHPWRISMAQKDYHFFLQNISLAQTHFYLNYQGYDEQHRSVPPCSVVETWLMYLQQITKASFSNFKQYPATLYDPQYNRVECPNYYSYFKTLAAFESQTLFVSDSPNDPPNFDPTIAIADWLQFFCQPVKYFLQRHYNLYYEQKNTQVRDRELFELNPLERWTIKEGLMQKAVGQSPLKEWKEKGYLPLSNLGNITYLNLQTETRALKDVFVQLQQNNTARYEAFELELDEYKLEGKLGPFYGKRLLHYQLSSSIKERFKCKLNQLLMAAAGWDYEIYYIDKKIEKLAPLKQDIAKDKIRHLIKIYQDGQQTPFLFSADLKAKDYSKLIKQPESLVELLKYQAAYFEALDWSFFKQEGALKSFQKNVQYLLVELLELSL